MNNRSILATVLLVFACLLPGLALAGGKNIPDIKPAIKFGFLENQGQWPREDLYRIQASGFSVAFMEDGVRFCSGRESDNYRMEDEEYHARDEEGTPETEAYEYYVWKLGFSGGNTSSEVVAKDIVAARTNFFMGSDQSKWKTKVPEWRELTYQEVWEGIDVRFFLTEDGALKYEFLLAPGADPEVIRIDFEGLNGIEILENGEMRLDHPWGPVTEDKPYAFTESDGHAVPVKFAQTGKMSYGFSVDSIPEGEAWVIDPLILYWSSYTNVSQIGSNYASDVGYDQNGYLYMTGKGTSSLPATIGASQTVYGGGGYDAYVARFTPDGSNIDFLTYIGGSGLDWSKSMSVSPNGRVFVCGWTTSMNFPTSPGAMATFSGNSYSAWAACITSDGSALIYSTLFASGLNSSAEGVVSVSNDEAIFVGNSANISGTFPTTSGAFQTTNAGSFDGWVCRVSADGTYLVWSTIVGGNGPEYFYDVAVNDLEEPYVVGKANSGGYPVSPGAWRGAGQSVLTRLNATGTGIVYSTYFASSGDLKGVDVHPSNREAYVVGEVSVGNFNPPPGAYQPAFGGYVDVVVGRMNATGTAPIYATYLGGPGTDRGFGIAAKSNGEAYVSGFTGSPNLPGSSCQYQSSHGGDTDGFVAHFSASGNTLGAAGLSFWGGTSADYYDPRIALRESPAGDTLFCALTSHSSDFPVTPGAFQTTKLNGTDDIQVGFKLIPFSPDLPDVFNCGQDSIEVGVPSQITNIAWSTGDTTPTTWINQPGQYSFSGTLYNCPIADTFNVIFGSVMVDLGADTVLCPGSIPAINLNSGVGTNWLWSTSATTSTINVTSPGTYWVTATDSVTGCSGSDTIEVALNMVAIANLTAPTVCPGTQVLLDADTANNYPGATFLWSNNTNTQQATYSGGNLAWVDVTINGCTIRDSIVVPLYPTPSVNLGSDTTICDTNSFTLNADPTYSAWLWSNGATTSSATFTQSGTVWVQVTDSNGCEGGDTLQLTFSGQVPVNLGPAQSFCDGGSVSLHADPNNAYPGATFLWSNGAMTPQNSISTSGWAWVEVTLPGGCVLSDSVLLTALPLPGVDIGPDSTLCGGGNYVATPISIGTGIASYLWSNGNSGTSAIFTSPGTIWLQVTDSLGCTNRDSLLLSIDPTPPPNLGPDQSICGSASILLLADPNGDAPGATFLWHTGSTASQITVSNAGWAWVEQTSANGCLSRDSMLISTIPFPSPNLSGDTLVCDADSLELYPGSYQTYLWSDGSTDPRLTVTQAGEYSVTVSNGGFCLDSAMIKVGFDRLPLPDLGPDLELCRTDLPLLTASPLPGTTILWSTGSTDNSIEPLVSGDYWIEMENVCGTASDTVRVTYLQELVEPLLPNVFSPNNDGINDCFQVESQLTESYWLQVFDRWGRLMYETQNSSDCWNGLYKNEPAPESVYYAKIRMRACNGELVSRAFSVTLVR